MRRRFLVDANHLGAVIHPRGELLPRLESAHERGFIFGVCLPVLAEIHVGIVQSSDPSRNRETLRRVRRFVRLWPLEESLAVEYGAIHLELKRKGRVLSMTDMFLAALGRQMNLALLSTDTDFDALPDIRRENWL